MVVVAERSVAVNDVYITDALYSRAPKMTDYRREKLAMQDLARQMVDHPLDVLPRLVDLAIELCAGISGGISLYESEPAPGVFRWHHLRGSLMPFTGATTPRNFSPCGITLDLNKTILVQHPERIYTWLVDANVALAECLLVPLYIGGSEPLGTLWIVSEDVDHFDSGHARVMMELATFAGMAVRMVRTEERLKSSLEQQETLTREMSHRVKNMFSIFGGLIRATAKSASTPVEMADVLSGRMQALAAANALVRRNLDDMTVADAADLGEIVRTILEPHERSGAKPRCVVDGPPVKLGDSSINGIALVLHEFATNAAKYGALKNDGGSVAVKWTEADGGLVLEWAERGGPAFMVPPRKTGFGTKLSQSTVVGQFSGALTYDWQPDGVKITMSLPTANLSR